MAAHLIKSEDFKSDTLKAFDALRHLITHFRSSLESERAEAKLDADKLFANRQSVTLTGDTPLDDTDKTHFDVIHAYGPFLHSYYGYLPNLINYSCVLQLYTLFEDRGTALCKELRALDSPIPLTIEELKGRTGDNPNVDHLWLYLEKLCNLKYNRWHDLKLFAKIRHRIIHNAGVTSDVALHKRINETTGLELYPPIFDKAKAIAEYRELVAKGEDVSMLASPEWLEEEEEKQKNKEPEKRSIIVKYAYIDRMFDVVKGLFLHAFEEKNIPGHQTMNFLRTDVGFSVETVNGETHVDILYED